MERIAVVTGGSAGIGEASARALAAETYFARLGQQLAKLLDEVTADGAVPLARLMPAGIDVHGAPTRAQIILFRRPLESRAKRGADLLELVHEVLVQQVATHLGVDEDTIDRGPE